MQLGAVSPRRSTRFDNVLRMEPFGFRNALLLEDAGEHDLDRPDRRLSTSSRSKTLRRSVLERGSSTAHKRAPG